MKFTQTSLEGAYLITPTPFEDHRGFFFRSFCVNEFAEQGLLVDIKQVNRSGTYGKGSFRGMHFQHPPYAETKIVECIKGIIFDVIIDIRKNSPTFLQWYGIELSESNKQKLYIPKGFAHGFQSISEYAEINYLVSQFYHKDSEGIIHYNDPLLDIQWPLAISTISEKDNAATFLEENFNGLLI